LPLRLRRGPHIRPNGDYHGPIRLPEGAGSNPTNLAFHNGYLYVTESEKGEIWRVKTKIPGINLMVVRRSPGRSAHRARLGAWLNENLGDHHDGQPISEKRVIPSTRSAEGTDHQSAINYNSLPGDVRRTSR